MAQDDWDNPNMNPYMASDFVGDPQQDNQILGLNNNQENMQEQQKPIEGYIKLQENQDFQFKGQDKENIQPQENAMYQDHLIYELVNANPKENKKQSNKKQISLQQALIIVQQKLSENSTIENRISGLKFLSQKLRQAKPNTEKAIILCNWLDAMKITDKFLHEDSHPQILKNMNSIIKYLYENQKLSEEWIINFAQSGLQSSHQQYFKVLQSLLSFLKIQHLECVFDLICHKGNIEDTNIGGLLNNIVSNKYFSQQIKSIETEKRMKPPQQKLTLLEQFQNMQNPQNREYWEQLQRKSQQQDEASEKQNIKAKQLTLRLFKFLIDVAEKHQKLDKNQKNDKVGYNYYQILNKLVFSKHEFLSNQLCSTLPDLLKTGKINSVWILQTCLKIDFGSNNKQKKNQGKFNFISKLANQNLYEHLLIILAKCRLFNKTVIDKILNILILLSKNYKPLDQVYTQFIWKILGLNSRQQKQRQQFFTFVKDILRNQSNFTEEAVYFIFFQILMSLSAEWFSLKILDCLQMLFMRLNQDLKLISYTDQTYSIQDPDLVGIDKFWYIYFYSNDSKVTKKCKDILWKLATYNSTSQIKVKLLKQYVQKITKYMSYGPQQLRIEFCNKGFDIIDKMMEQVQKKQANLTQQIEINLINECKDALAPKKVTLRFSQKCTLQFLRQQITQAITPANTSIKLICKGQFLKGQRMTLKDLRIENKNTITVIDDEQVTKQKEQKVSQLNNQILKQLIDIFGSQIKEDLLKFIVQKMQGQNLQRITDAVMDEDKLARMTSQFQQQNPKNQQQENKIVSVHFDEQHKQMNLINQSLNKGAQMENQRSQPNMVPQLNYREQIEDQLPKFSYILVSNQNYIRQILFCASEGSKKRGWTTIKNLPKPAFFVTDIQKKCQQQNWQVLFPKQQANQMTCTYNAHLLKYIFTLDKTKIQRYMLEYGGFSYLIDWLRRLPEGSSNIVLEQVSNLLVITLEQNCPALTTFRERINKKQQKMLLPLLFQQNFLQTQSKNNLFVKYQDQTFFNWLINLLLSFQKGNNNSTFPSQNIAEIILCFVLGSNQRLQNVLQLPLNEIFYIIHNHGFVGQYIFLTSMSKVLGQNFNEEKRLNYCRKFLQLANFGFNYNILEQTKSNIIYLYDIIACVLDKINLHTQIQTQITLKCIQSIKNQSQFIQTEHLIGILQLLKLCLKLCKKNGNIDAKQKIQSTVSQFSEWLFKGYLFDLQKPRKHIRNKSVRKVCYQILENIAENSEENAKKLVDQIVKIEIKQRNKQEDYVDFRSQSYVGLTNLGATCYINSLLQQIYHTKFSKVLLQKGDTDPEHTQRMKQLKHIFMQMCYSIKNCVNPKKFIRNIEFYGQPINTSVQQDASEFLLCLFDYIQGQGCQPEVYEVFGGYLCNQITIIDEQIQDQQLVKNNMEHFNSLTIDIKGKKNLQEALAYLIKPQMLDGQNRYFCQQLGRKTKASKRCYIEKMPNILILTLKRFQYDLDSHTRHKLNDYFEFPFELDMHKYSASFLRLKEESSLDSKYKLAGILVHSGSAESGHYYSYIKIGQQWFQFNDKVVSQFNILNNLKTQCFGCSQGKKTRNAYMLFYQKVQTMYHGVYLNEISETNTYKKQINQENSIFLKTRLIYDDNYKNLLQQLKELTFDPKLSIYIQNIFGKKSNPDQNKKQQPELVHFDAEQHEKLIDQCLDL